MSPTDYVVGLAVFAFMLTGTFAGAWLLLRRRFSHLTEAPRVVAYGMLATLGVMAVHVVPLALGIMDRWTVMVATVIWLAAAWRVPARVSEPDPAPSPEPRDSGKLTWVLAGVALAALAIVSGAIMVELRTVAPTMVDTLNFHMPGVAAWIQTGSLWQIDVYLRDVAPGHYPNNGDVLVAASVLPWRSDFLAHFMMYPFWLLTGASVYALAAELRVPRATAVMAAALVLAIPRVSLPALEGALVDTVMIFGFATGLLFLARHNRNGRTSELVLAGLALGLSFGTKWYAVSAVPTVVLLWALARAWDRRLWHEWWRQTALVTGMVALAGGIWMLRNLVESANPVFPVKVSLFGTTIFDAPVDRVRSLGGFTIADYIGDASAWSDYILPQYRDAIAAPAALALLGGVVALGLLVVRRRRDDGPAARLVLVGLAITVLLGMAYCVTPYTAGGPWGMPVFVDADARYLVPTLIVAAVLGAWAATRLPKGEAAFGVLGLLAVLDGLLQLKETVGLTIGIRNAGIVVGAGLLAAAMVVGTRRALQDRPRRVQAGALTAMGLVLALVLAVGGREVQRDFMAKRYFHGDAVADVLNTRAGSGNRVGLAGTWTDDGLAPPLLAFGPRFRNHVAYVGWSDKDVLRRFGTRDAFVRALDDQRYNWLVVGRGRPPKSRVDEERWAMSAGFRIVARSPRLTLLRRGGA